MWGGRTADIMMYKHENTAHTTNSAALAAQLCLTQVKVPEKSHCSFVTLSIPAPPKPPPPSLSFFFCLCLCLPPPLSQFVSLFVSLSVSVSLSPSLSVSLCLSLSLSLLYLSLCLSLSLSVCLSVCLSLPFFLFPTVMIDFTARNRAAIKSNTARSGPTLTQRQEPGKLHEYSFYSCCKATSASLELPRLVNRPQLSPR